jgi:2-oxoglutarate dehydrogenase complex dehydrogenase (E1) component-like enzyme
MLSNYQNHFEDEYTKSKNYVPTLANTTNPKNKGSRAYTHKWQGIVPSQNGSEPAHSGVDTEVLKDIGRKSVQLPKDFNVHKRLVNFHI